MFQLSPVGRELIRGIEKLSTTVYYDPDVATVGYGHAIKTPDGHLVSIKAYGRTKCDALADQYMMSKFGAHALTPAQAEALFNEDMKEFTDAVNAVCDDKTYQAEFDAMVSFAFNCGSAGFGRSSVAKFHKAGARKVGDVSLSGLAAWSKSAAAASPTNIQQAFAAWSKDDGKWLLGLYRRRLTELLVYGGHTLDEAKKTAWGFAG